MGQGFPREVRVLRAPCMGRCDKAPAVEVGHNHLAGASAASVIDAIDGADVGKGVDRGAVAAHVGGPDERAAVGGDLGNEGVGVGVEGQVRADQDGEGRLRGIGGLPKGRTWRPSGGQPPSFST